jgi:hypothetical protein
LALFAKLQKLNWLSFVHREESYVPIVKEQWREESSCPTKSLKPNELKGQILVKVHFILKAQIYLDCTKRTNHSKIVQTVMYALLAKNKTYFIGITKTKKG